MSMSYLQSFSMKHAGFIGLKWRVWSETQRLYAHIDHECCDMEGEIKMFKVFI